MDTTALVAESYDALLAAECRYRDALAAFDRTGSTDGLGEAQAEWGAAFDAWVAAGGHAALATGTP